MRGYDYELTNPNLDTTGAAARAGRQTGETQMIKTAKNIMASVLVIAACSWAAADALAQDELFESEMTRLGAKRY